MHFRFCWLCLNYHLIFFYFFISPLLTAMHLINYNVKNGEKEFIHYLFYFDYTEKRCSRRCGCWHSVILRDNFQSIHQQGKDICLQDVN